MPPVSRWLTRVSTVRPYSTPSMLLSINVPMCSLTLPKPKKRYRNHRHHHHHHHLHCRRMYCHHLASTTITIAISFTVPVRISITRSSPSPSPSPSRLCCVQSSLCTFEFVLGSMDGSLVTSCSGGVFNEASYFECLNAARQASVTVKAFLEHAITKKVEATTQYARS